MCMIMDYLNSVQSSDPIIDDNQPDDSAVWWASLLRGNLGKLYSGLEVDEECRNAPRRSGGYHTSSLPMARIAELIYPSPTRTYHLENSDTVQPPTKYYKDIGHLTSAINVQQRAAEPNFIQRVKWTNRIKKQGPWDEEHDPLSTDGIPALPMPVKISDGESLESFFSHLSLGGSHQVGSSSFKAGKEPYYAVDTAEFEKGVLYADGRMDLCKKVLGPPNIGPLMQSLESNTFVKHFLLGNNIIGPTGAYHIAAFVDRNPTRIETWYLAGNCIDSVGLRSLIDSWVKSLSITNVWLKRNPLGPSSVPHIYTLIRSSPRLRTLDLDQTELGDHGVATLFISLYELPANLPFRHLYLNGTGISIKACDAIGKYLASPTCALQSLYINNNPIGDAGALAIAAGLKTNTSLQRLVMSSCGLKDSGVISLLKALTRHATISYLDLGQSFSTDDLGTRYNYLTDEIFPSLNAFITGTPSLLMLNLGTTALTRPTLELLATSILESASKLLSYNIGSIHPKSSFPALKARPTGHLSEFLLANVKKEFGPDMTYEAFEHGQLRFLRSPRDVRLIDSVYRNRDAGDARRGKLVLEKWWAEGDGTVEGVMGMEAEGGL